MSLAKRLAKCARRSIGNAGWGLRHFLTLRIPRAAYPTQRPTMPADIAERLGTPDGWGGYVRDHGDGTITKVMFSEVHSGGDPRKRPIGTAIVGVEAQGTAEHPRFHWTEVRAWTGTATPEDIGRPADVVLPDLDSPEWAWTIEAARVRAEQHRWNDTARRLDWCSEDVRCLYGECEFWSKTTYHSDDARTYGVTFAVKPWYVGSFALHASRLSRALRGEGVDARWGGL